MSPRQDEAFEKGCARAIIINRKPPAAVETGPTSRKRIEEARDAGRRSLLLLVRRAGDPRFVALSLG